MPFLGVGMAAVLSKSTRNASKILRIWENTHGKLKICKTKQKFEKAKFWDSEISKNLCKIKGNICKLSWQKKNNTMSPPACGDKLFVPWCLLVSFPSQIEYFFQDLLKKSPGSWFNSICQMDVCFEADGCVNTNVQISCQNLRPVSIFVLSIREPFYPDHIKTINENTAICSENIKFYQLLSCILA